MKTKWYIAGNDIEQEQIDDFMNQRISCVCTFNPKDGIEQQSHMQLISAAPDMLQALRLAEEELAFDQSEAVVADSNEPRIVDQALNAVRAAIAKAEGE